ncbi:response regulator transcription factor [Kineosporia babensis]|uniref:Response regulator transcription factor n=1 Tax=Kineosporia babensis TaxID=499548 RepID=A0A9X1NNX7_9ACTN|nr:response regulator transcription factor [Kineosporia babensis]MCD5317221.1 response regulator transcription factor [Kineosporia babensis]
MNDGVVRVVIADDHPLFRAGVAAILDGWDDIEVVAQTADGLETVKAADSHRPDVILMDLRMPVLNGLAATAQITTSHPDIAVLVITMDNDDESVFAALRAGASGYLLKEANGDELHRTIHGVARGEAIFGPGIARRVRAFFSTSRPQLDPFPQLSRSEWEVLNLLARGDTNPQIAIKLGRTDKTISNKVSSILTKMQAGSRAEAVAMARNVGVGER